MRHTTWYRPVTNRAMYSWPSDTKPATVGKPSTINKPAQGGKPAPRPPLAAIRVAACSRVQPDRSSHSAVKAPEVAALGVLPPDIQPSTEDRPVFT